VPVPVRIGAPALDYPWPWSVVRWVPGTSAEDAPVRDADSGARTLAEFLLALHRPAPDDAPRNPWRGIPLTDRVDRTLTTIDGLRPRGLSVDLEAVTDAFERAARRPAWSGPRVWLHGDLHPRHVLTVDGRISGVIDFGDLTSGDPATDLAAVWMLLPLQGHEAFRRVYGPDDDTWERGRGWAIVFGALLLEVALNDGDGPRRQVAEATLLRTLETP
jgi:aminoglycoside phosphotransferase (APT) family kinase protein